MRTRRASGRPLPLDCHPNDWRGALGRTLGTSKWSQLANRAAQSKFMEVTKWFARPGPGR
jgi:hypothetical protein